VRPPLVSLAGGAGLDLVDAADPVAGMLPLARFVAVAPADADGDAGVLALPAAFGAAVPASPEPAAPFASLEAAVLGAETEPAAAAALRPAVESRPLPAVTPEEVAVLVAAPAARPVALLSSLASSAARWAACRLASISRRTASKWEVSRTTDVGGGGGALTGISRACINSSCFLRASCTLRIVSSACRFACWNAQRRRATFPASIDACSCRTAPPRHLRACRCPWTLPNRLPSEVTKLER